MPEGSSTPPTYSVGQATAYFVQKHFASLTPKHSTIAHLNPATTVIVTFQEQLQHAVARCVNMRLPELPAFVLIDQIAEKQRPLNALLNPITLDTGAAYDLRILARNEIHMLGDLDYCLFSPRLDGSSGLWNLYTMWRETGHREAVSFDIIPLLNYSVSRSPMVGFFHSCFSDICTVYNALSDTESRETFLRAMKSIETGDPGYLEQAAYPHYHHPLVKAEPGDKVIEGGPADGQTTAAFAREVGISGSITAFEPLKSYVAEASENTRSFDNVTVENLGLWSGKQIFHIEDDRQASKLVEKPTEASEACETIALDTYLSEKGQACDLIKLDIEGAETECLKGAMETIRKYRPKLQISIYHRAIDYIDLPLMIIRENLDYEFYMGHHLPWFNETVLYATAKR